MRQVDEELYNAALYGDLEKVKTCLSRGAEINAVYDDESPLMAAIFSDDETSRAALVQYLLENGADPNFMGIDNCGVVFEAVLIMDARVMEMLLIAGANPNFMMDAGSLYDCAELDYRYEIFEFSLPIEPTEKDQENEEAWLDYLDRCAEQRQVEKPDFLRLLRKYGAKTAYELELEE